MLRQTEAYQLNPVTRCMSKDHTLNKWYFVAKTTEVTITSGLPGGFRDAIGTFYGVGEGGYWWSSTEVATGVAWYRGLIYYNGNVGKSMSSLGLRGFSVRCVKDSSPPKPKPKPKPVQKFNSADFLD